MELKVGVKDSVYANIQVVRAGLPTEVIIAPNNEITTGSFRLKVGKYFRVRVVDAGVTTRDVYVNGSAVCSARTGKL
ncbi:hypothetical protein [Nocardioides pelophilus]|uniref:hypothetical protein n=1 Tax=Nocardioides pelophilus TaxID=2172019 RepID=UPI001602F221|nr:hypothetical protein [Nocardioides pelophilus]